jgi:hypothetical protein
MRDEPSKRSTDGLPDGSLVGKPATGARQLHMWISADDFEMLRALAAERDQTMSAVVRRAIRLLAMASRSKPR